MKSKRLLIKIQYLGFRYHGVQKQSELPSIQQRVEECLRSALSESQKINTRFASRTDAMVSALETYFLLMSDEEMDSLLIEKALQTLPPDIRVLEVANVPDDFTILKAAKTKTYRYYFSHNTHAHPFSAPFITTLSEELDIEIMKEGCALFLGKHDFSHYVHKKKIDTSAERTITSCVIKENVDFKATFFPENSWYFEVSSSGFMRGQVRMMMGALFNLGLKQINLSDVESTLKNSEIKLKKWMAPASGLILYKTELTYPEFKTQT